VFGLPIVRMHAPGSSHFGAQLLVIERVVNRASRE